MTLHSHPSPSRAIVVPLRAGPPLLQGFIVPIADSVAVVMFDEPTASSDDRPRLTARVDGEPLGRPTISTSLALRTGGRRHLSLVGLGAPRLMRSRVTLALGPEIVAAIDPDWLQPPVTDETALVAGLSEAGRRRLAKLFLTTGASLFGADGASEFARAAYRLLDLLSVPAVAPVAWCPVATAGSFLTYRLDREVEAAQMGAVVCLSSGQVRRMTGCQLASEQIEGGTLLHVYLPHALPPGASLIALGASALCLHAPAGDMAPRALVPWLARRDAATRGWVRALVEPAADADPIAAALVREMGCDGDAPPMLATSHLAGTPEGLLYAVEIEDPHDLVRAVRVERGGVWRDVEAKGESLAAPMLAGYLALSRRSRVEDQFRLRLVYRSGRVRTVAEGQLARYRGAIPSALRSAPAGAAEGIARARLSLEPATKAVTTTTFGTPPEQPNLSVIVAVGDNLDLIRARAAMIFAEPGGRDVELVYHVSDGPLALAARAAIADTAAVFGIAHRLVILPAASDSAARLLAALDATRGPGILALGAGVLPAGPGWLAPWLCRLVSARPILGGTLIDPAGAVLHAGGASGSGTLRHVGLPWADLPHAPAATTMLVSSECVGLTRTAARLLRETATRYPNPDVMLDEIVARLRAEGKEAATLLRSRFVRYADTLVDDLEVEVDRAALRLVLKRSFSPSEEEG